MAKKRTTKRRKGVYVVVFKELKRVEPGALERALKTAIVDLDVQIVFIADDPGGGWFVRPPG